MAAVIAVAAVLGLAGCGFGAGGASPTTTPPVTTRSTTVPSPATTLAAGACKEYLAAGGNLTSAVGYPDLFTADAEADGAGRLAATYSNLATAFDTVKTQIQQIDQYQSSNSSYSNSNAATLSQAQGLLRGDLVAVGTLCHAEGL